MEGQQNVVRMLVVEQQARMDIRNWEGWFAMIWAIVRGHVEIVKFLAERVRLCQRAVLKSVARHARFRFPQVPNKMTSHASYRQWPV
jgi:ankyrin repeat protein